MAIHNLMEDAATAEISRSQVWQWVHNEIRLADGRPVTRDLVQRIIGEELATARAPGTLRRGPLRPGGRPVQQVALADDFAEFLTLPAYAHMP